MRRIYLTLMLCFFPAIIMAQDRLPRIEWNTVFIENAADIETKVLKGGEIALELRLPGPVMVRKSVSLRGTDFVAIDQSESGASGCLFAMFLDVYVMVNMCSIYQDLTQAELLQARLNRLSRFVGENSVPPIVGNDP